MIWVVKKNDIHSFHFVQPIKPQPVVFFRSPMELEAVPFFRQFSGGSFWREVAGEGGNLETGFN